MKKITILSSITLIFLTYFLFTLVSIKSDNPACTSCPPTDPSCVISCNSALLSQTNPTTLYGANCYNYTLPEDFDVYLNKTEYGATYQIQLNWTSKINPPFSCLTGQLCCISPQCSSKGYGSRSAGNYYFKINKTGGFVGNYNISLSCGHFCGNGKIDSWYGETCDYNAVNPDNPCKSYQFCNNTCDCQNVTTGGCDYYDYCDLGHEPNKPSISCCKDKSSGLDTNCCIAADCSTLNSNAIAKREYCWNKDYDITYVCVDTDYRNHTIMTCPL